MTPRTRFDEQLDVARDSIDVHLSIGHATRRPFHDRLRDVDFLLSRLPPGRVHDELRVRRDELVETYVAYLQSSLRKSA